MFKLGQQLNSLHGECVHMADFSPRAAATVRRLPHAFGVKTRDIKHELTRKIKVRLPKMVNIKLT
jgi:hypothetical protein